MTLERSVLAAVTAVIVGCGGQSQAVRPNIDPVRAPDSSGTPVTEPGGKGLVPAPSLPPAVAFARGLMPLKETGVDAFRQLHPTYDGRGVIIAVLDGGIDAGVPGLITTSTGDRKLLDLRDFSGEGRIALEPAQLTGDSIRIAGKLLRGMSRVASLAVAGSVYTGVVSERAMGEAPAADLNGNGEAEDLLPVVVGRASDGWFLLADTDGDGTLAGLRRSISSSTATATAAMSPASPPDTISMASRGSTAWPPAPRSSGSRSPATPWAASR
jgi:hypothetical protein